MCCWNINGNGKKSSEFICLSCLDWKTTYIRDIQRHQQREPFHKKSPHIVCNTTKLLECMRDAATFFMVKGMENANETNPKKIIEVMNDAMKKVEEILEDIAE